MPLRITIDIFSGRPNPVITLAGGQASAALASAPRSAFGAVEDVPRPTAQHLGYRGLVVQQMGDPIEMATPFLSRTTSAGMEEHLFQSGGVAERLGMKPDLLEFIRQEIARTRAERTVGGARATLEQPAGAALVQASGCERAPVYEPEFWNDGGQRQLHNNCYNYSSNYRTDSYAQPGRSWGLEILEYTSSTIKSLAIDDGLIDAPLADNKCPPEGALVALVVAPGFDFHWYRKGRDGLWTHKPGFTPVTNLDNVDQPVFDPRTAQRGPYLEFGGFMVVRDGHIRLL